MTFEVRRKGKVSCRTCSKLSIQVVFFIHLLLYLMSKEFVVSGFELVSVRVEPKRPRTGDEVRLHCLYQLDQSESLYSLKWNKKDSEDLDREFYRFSSRRPTKQKFPLPDLDVDLMRSTDGTVILRNVTEFASGIYKCEITAAGTFRTLAKELPLVISDRNNSSNNHYKSWLLKSLIVLIALPFFHATRF